MKTKRTKQFNVVINQLQKIIDFYSNSNKNENENIDTALALLLYARKNKLE